MNQVTTSLVSLWQRRRESRLPVHRPLVRRRLHTLVLSGLWVLLTLTGLGVFSLYFAIDWAPEPHGTGPLFSLRVHAGSAFNLFSAERYGMEFWCTQLILLAFVVGLPRCRVRWGSLALVLLGALLLLIHELLPTSQPLIPVGFHLLTLSLLLATRLGLGYLGEIHDRQHVVRLLERFVPSEVATVYRRDPDSLALTGQSCEVTVMFCDVVSFSEVSEMLPAESLAAWLNEYFSVVSRVVVEHGGVIDKYIGDSVMAVWGAPVVSTHHARDALAAALEIQQMLARLDACYRERGWPSIRAGIGMSTGRVNAGVLGSRYRLDYTVVGDTVNMAQRIEALTRQYSVPVLVGDSTAACLDDMRFRKVDTVALKGRRQSVTVFEPLGWCGVRPTLDESCARESSGHNIVPDR